jgi:hypothetical protein
MGKCIQILILTLLTSCINIPTFIDGKVEGNVYENDYLKFKIPNGWKVNKAGGFIIFTMQKQIKKDNIFEFPTVHFEAGTINKNSYSTYFDNSFELAKGSLESFSKNDIYSTNNKIDTTIVNGITLYSFETKILNKKFKIPDLLQTHYYFNIDTVFFHLSVSNYDRFVELNSDYKLLLESIEKK